MKKRSFGELEALIIQTLTSLKRATVRDVSEALDYPGSYTTILTVMSRMAKKNELLRKREGKQFVYWIAPRSSTGGIFQRLQQKFFKGNKVAFVSYLLQDAQDLSHEDLNQLEALIEQKRKERT